jgi:uncharacterized membrane protein YphA (DoxX/SURF4 family)
MKTVKSISWKSWFLTLLRVAIGWHFLYEGISKLAAGDWSASGYLRNSHGFLSGFYHWLASSEGLMMVVDPLNMCGLVAIGLALFLGIMVRPAAICGALLLGSYYLAYPPFGASHALGGEPGLYIVNAVFIEAAILVVFASLEDKGYGLGPLVRNLLKRKRTGEEELPDSSSSGRREVLQNLATIPLLGLVGWGARESARKYSIDGVTGATITVGGLDLSELKGELPKGTIGDHQISRLVMGGNLIGGWAHSRDLLYVSSLFKAYNTEQKVFETLRLAEQAGINAINIGFPSNPLLKKYKQLTGSRIKVISQVAAPDMGNKDYFSAIEEAVDFGVEIIQVQGNQSDWLVRDGKVEVIGFDIRISGLLADGGIQLCVSSRLGSPLTAST